MDKIQSVFNWLFYISLWGLALMTGILSLLREAIQIFAPEKAPPRSLFWNCIVIAFIISSAILWFLEHQKVNNLTEALYSKRMQLYKTFVEEKT